jgi:hypothetical protein
LDSTLSYRLGVESHTRNELEATVAARRELGPAHDEELIAGFLDRIEKEIDKRVDERVGARRRARRDPTTVHPGNLGVAIPLVVVAGIFGGAWGIAAVAAALVIIFVATTVSHR